MQNNKNIAVLDEGWKESGSQLSQLQVMSEDSAPISLCSIQIESVVTKSPAGLNTLFKQLLIDEDLRENFLKGYGTWKENSNVNTDIFQPFPCSLPFAERIVNEVCGEWE